MRGCQPVGEQRRSFQVRREAYFWALLAGLGVFAGGAAFSLREGIDELLHPGTTSRFAVAYVVLAVSAAFDLLSFRQSAGQMTRRARRFGRGVRAESRATSDPTLRTVYLSDAVSIGADVVTLVALALTQLTGSSYLREWPPCSSGWRLSESAFGSSGVTTTSWSAPG